MSQEDQKGHDFEQSSPEEQANKVPIASESEPTKEIPVPVTNRKRFGHPMQTHLQKGPEGPSTEEE